MTISLSTTTISVKRPSNTERDQWDETPEDPSNLIASGVRATIKVNFQTARSGGPGDTETVEFLLMCDPTDLTYNDIVVDEATDTEYEVTWALTTPGVAGLGHTQAGLKTVTGFGQVA